MWDLREKLSIFLVFIGSSAGAYTGLNHGLGVSASSLGGFSGSESGYLSYYDPARIPFAKGRFNFDVSHGKMDFKTEGSVLVDSPFYRTQDGNRREATPDVALESEQQWSTGMNLPLPSRRFGVGFTASGPFGTLRRFRSKTPYDFQTLRYGTTSPQFRATVGAGWEAIPDWLSVGASALFYISAVGDADASAVSDNPTGRLYMDVGLQSALIASVALNRPRFQTGIVYRQAQSPHLQVDVKGRLEIGGLSTFDLPMSLQATLYYEPETWEWGTSYRLSSHAWIQAGISLHRWSRFRPSYTVMGVTGRRGVQRSIEPQFHLKDTWDPHASIRWEALRGLELSTGYRFRQSPLKEESFKNVGNLLDSHTHIWGVGAEKTFEAGSLIPVPIRVGLFGQVHRLVPSSVQKDNPDSIGAPGYRFSGWGYYFGTGIQASL